MSEEQGSWVPLDDVADLYGQASPRRLLDVLPDGHMVTFGKRGNRLMVRAYGDTWTIIEDALHIAPGDKMHNYRVAACVVCGEVTQIVAAGRCRSCYDFCRQHGRDRTLEESREYRGETVKLFLSERQLVPLACLVEDLGYGGRPRSLAQLLRREARRLEWLADDPRYANADAAPRLDTEEVF